MVMNYQFIPGGSYQGTIIFLRSFPREWIMMCGNATVKGYACTHHVPFRLIMTGILPLRGREQIGRGYHDIRMSYHSQVVDWLASYPETGKLFPGPGYTVRL